MINWFDEVKKELSQIGNDELMEIILEIQPNETIVGIIDDDSIKKIMTLSWRYQQLIIAMIQGKPFNAKRYSVEIRKCNTEAKILYAIFWQSVMLSFKPILGSTAKTSLGIRKDWTIVIRNSENDEDVIDPDDRMELHEPF